MGDIMSPPKLSNKMNVKIEAVVYITGFYLKETKFNHEFHQIAGTHRSAISYYVLSWLDSHKGAIPSEEYKKAYEKLNRNLEGQVTDKDINMCLLALDELAWNWNLVLPKCLAGLMFFIQACAEELKTSGVSTVELGLAFHPAINAPPLRLIVYDWDLIELGRIGMLENINKTLEDYTQILHKKGISTFPYRLEEHASWWFAHYVHGESYKQIGEECKANPETVKRKVWNFRRLLNISLKK